MTYLRIHLLDFNINRSHIYTKPFWAYAYHSWSPLFGNLCTKQKWFSVKTMAYNIKLTILIRLFFSLLFYVNNNSLTWDLRPIGGRNRDLDRDRDLGWTLCKATRTALSNAYCDQGPDHNGRGGLLKSPWPRVGLNLGLVWKAKHLNPRPRPAQDFSFVCISRVNTREVNQSIV